MKKRPNVREEELELVDQLLDIEDGLTDWEAQFVESLGRRVHDLHLSLTDTQLAKARQIQQERLGA